MRPPTHNTDGKRALALVHLYEITRNNIYVRLTPNKINLVIALGSNLTREFLEKIFNYIIDALDRYKQEEYLTTREMMPLHAKIMAYLFPNEMQRTENAVRRVLDEVEKEVSTYKRYVIDMLVRMFREVIEGKKEDLVAQTFHVPLHPFFNTLESMSRMLLEIADVFSSKSYTAAFVTVSALESRLQPDREGNSSVEVEVKKEASQIYSVWSRLAEEGICLIGKPALMQLHIEKICETFQTLGENLSGEKTLIKIHDNMVLGNFPGLSEVIYKALPTSVEDGRLKAHICDYIVRHFDKLREEMWLSGMRPIEDIKIYLNEVFVKRSFLEYEVYSALLKQGIAAIPGLRFLMPDPEYMRREPYEVDVVATAEGELWLVEVTTSRSSDHIQRKADRYQKLKEATGADKVVFVGSPETCDLSREVFSSHSMGDFFLCDLTRLYSDISKLLASQSRRLHLR